MTSEVYGQIQNIDIGNFNQLVSEVGEYRNLEIANPVKIPIKFVELEDQLKLAGENLPSIEYNGYTQNFIFPLIKHLNDRADEIQDEELSNKTQAMHLHNTSFSLFPGTSETFSPKTILEWNIKSSHQVFRMELTEMEEDAIKAALLHGIACSRGETSTICRTTFAAQRMIINLYQDFIDCEKSQGVQFCEQPPLPPLLSWGNGPATWTEKHTESIGLKNVAIVNLPIENSQRDILAWTTLAHEVSGHDLLRAANLLDELYQNVKDSLRAKGISEDATDYWVNNVGRIDEIASDILGVLNLGPAAAIGLIGYLKGLSPGLRLRSDGPLEDEHPADVLRGIVVANAVDRLAIENRAQWSSLLYKEVLKDCPKILKLDGKNISDQEAMRSAEIVSHTILNSFLTGLNRKSLRSVRIWNMRDQQAAKEFGACLSGSAIVPEYCKPPIGKQYAKHIIAAAAIESLKSKADHPTIFSNMVTLLSES